jgi:hypothetical protein
MSLAQDICLSDQVPSWMNLAQDICLSDQVPSWMSLAQDICLSDKNLSADNFLSLQLFEGFFFIFTYKNILIFIQTIS